MLEEIYDNIFNYKLINDNFAVKIDHPCGNITIH